MLNLYRKSGRITKWRSSFPLLSASQIYNSLQMQTLILAFSRMYT